MKHKINEQIKGSTVRVVGHEKYSNNVIALSEALDTAKDEGLDLVLINPNETPVVCKIMDYSKFMYELNKSKKKNNPPPLKEIKFSPNITDHDLNVKVNKAREFLTKGSHVNVEVIFKGREFSHKERGETVLLKFLEKLSDVGVFNLKFNYMGKKILHNIRPRKNT